MLAKNLRTPRGIRFSASSLTSIASMLAPTEVPVQPKIRGKHAREKPEGTMEYQVSRVIFSFT